jgi:signal transduction histidine kinase
MIVPSAEEGEVSGRAVMMLYDFIAARMPDGALERVNLAAGEIRPRDYFSDSVWITFEQWRRLLTAAGSELADIRELIGVVRDAELPESERRAMSTMVQTLVSPGRIFALSDGTTNPMNSFVTSEAKETGDTEWLFTLRFADGYTPYPEFCWFSAGQLAFVPRLFGFAPGTVVQESCLVDGGDACRFRVSWDPFRSEEERAEHFSLRTHILEARLEELQATVADLVSGEALEDVLIRITDNAARAIVAPSHLLVLDPELDIPRHAFASGLTAEQAEEVGPRLLDGAQQSDESWLVVDIVSPRRWYGRLAAIQRWGQFFEFGDALLTVYARLAAAALDAALALADAHRRAEEAHALLAELQRTQMQLVQAQKLESLGQLAAGVAHEINTPIQYISDNIRFLDESFQTLLHESTVSTAEHLGAETDQDPTVGHHVDAAELEFVRAEVPLAIAQAQEGIGRVTEIVRALKGLAHPSADVFSVADLNRMVSDATVVSRSEWRHVAQLELDLSPELPGLECCPGPLGQVFLNLIVNSAHSIKDRFAGSHVQGHISVATSCAEDLLSVRIADNGVGVPVEILDRIFDPFFTTKEVGSGTGQGLAISRAVIVDQHGGSIDVAPGIDGGASFTVTLPRRHAAANASP